MLGFVPLSAAPFSSTGELAVVVSGVQGNTALGSVTVAAEAVAFVSGVSATGEVGTVTVIGLANVPAVSYTHLTLPTKRIV